MGRPEITPQGMKRVGSYVVQVGAAALGFSTVAYWGLRSTPLPEDFAATPKLEYFAEHADEFDALFVGSSSVFRSFVPRVVDDELAERGIPFRSFNLGAPGMLGFEADHVLRAALALEPANLKYVFIEVGDWDPAQRRNLLVTRSVYWHGPRLSLRAIAGAWALPLPLAQRLDLVYDHARAFCWRLSSFGEGPRILAALRGDPQLQPLTAAEVASDLGYQSLEVLLDETHLERRQALLDDPVGYESAVERLAMDVTDAEASPRSPEASQQDRPGSCDLERYDIGALQDQVDAVLRFGAAPIYVVPAGRLTPTPCAAALLEAGVLPALFDWNDPRSYPALYDYENRYDRNHLDAEAARAFSRSFANQLADYLEAMRDE